MRVVFVTVGKKMDILVSPLVRSEYGVSFFKLEPIGKRYKIKFYT